MADLPYAIIVDGAGAVQERKLANHGVLRCKFMTGDTKQNHSTSRCRGWCWVALFGILLVTATYVYWTGPGDELAASVKVLSNTVEGATRTVVLQRPVAGASADHYTIPTAPGDVDMIVAFGNTPALA